jgi:hypothetical protein
MKRFAFVTAIAGLAVTSFAAPTRSATPEPLLRITNATQHAIKLVYQKGFTGGSLSFEIGPGGDFRGNEPGELLVGGTTTFDGKTATLPIKAFKCASGKTIWAKIEQTGPTTLVWKVQ